MRYPFAPQELSLKLKKLGFDEPCTAYFKANYFKMASVLNDNFTGRFLVFNSSSDLRANDCTAPTYSEALKWFEDKHSLFVDRRVQTSSNEILDITYTLKSWKFPPVEITFENPYDSFDREKADLACLKKLIEIVDPPKFKVVMLPTLELTKKGDMTLFGDNLVIASSILHLAKAPQKLYFLSDDKIDDGDYCYDQVYDRVVKVTGFADLPQFVTIESKFGELRHSNISNLRKIVATNDKSLKMPINEYLVRLKEADERDDSFLLPQIPESFSLRFIKAHNDKNPITGVNLEMETTPHCANLDVYDQCKDHVHTYPIKVLINNEVVVL